MKWRSALVAFLALVSPAGAIQDRHRANTDVWFHVSPLGDDTNNDCTDLGNPCRTIQYAVDRALRDWDFAGHQGYVKLAAGRYSGGAKVWGPPTGAYILNIVGQQSDNVGQSCSLEQASQVVVDGLAGTTIFDTQDYGLSVIRCLTVRAICISGPEETCTQRAGGVNGFNYRQTVVSDLAYIRFDALSIGITAVDQGSVNLGGVIWIGNNFVGFIGASGRSRVTIAAPIVFLNPVNIPYFIMSYTNSHVEFYPGLTLANYQFLNSSAGGLVWRGGTIITNGTFLPPAGCLQADPNQPGNCW